MISTSRILKWIDVGLLLTRRQSSWLRKYSILNTEVRNQITNEFDKYSFRVKVNSGFGKIMENVDKRVDAKAVSHWEKLGKRGERKNWNQHRTLEMKNEPTL